MISDCLSTGLNSIAFNPADWKQRDTGFMVDSFPHILGSDVAGTVVAKGDGQQTARFDIGERVFGLAMGLIAGKAKQYGAFQTHVTLKAENTSKTGNLTDNEAAVLPMAIANAGPGLWDILGVPKPPTSGSFATPTDEKEAIVVWGAASSVGALTVQLARASGLTVYATANPKHVDWLKDIGAKAVFDYRQSDAADQVVTAAHQDGATVRLVYDAVSTGEGSENSSFKAADVIKKSAGSGKLLTVLDVPDGVKNDPKIEVAQVFALTLSTSQIDLGKFLFNDWIEGALEKGVVKPAPKIRVIDGGFDALPKALETLKAGVSGEKLVMEVK